MGLCDGGLSCEVIFQDVLQKHQLLMGVMVPVGELMACSGCEVVLPHGVLGGPGAGATLRLEGKE